MLSPLSILTLRDFTRKVPIQLKLSILLISVRQKLKFYPLKCAPIDPKAEWINQRGKCLTQHMPNKCRISVVAVKAKKKTHILAAASHSSCHILLVYSIPNLKLIFKVRSWFFFLNWYAALVNSYPLSSPALYNITKLLDAKFKRILC